MRRKSVIKLILAIGLAAFGIFLILYISRILTWRSSAEHAAERSFKNLAAKYQDDPYGGISPEETLRLFLDALVKNDALLASKFFTIERQAEWGTALANWKNKGKLAAVISVLEKAGHGREVAAGIYQMAVSNETGEILFLIDFVKNEATQKWKIERF